MTTQAERDEIALGERWAGRMEQRLRHVEERVEKLIAGQEQNAKDNKQRMNWILGLVGTLLVTAVFNFIINGGLTQ